MAKRESAKVAAENAAKRFLHTHQDSDWLTNYEGQLMYAAFLAGVAWQRRQGMKAKRRKQL